VPTAEGEAGLLARRGEREKTRVSVYEALRRHATEAPSKRRGSRRNAHWPGIWGSLGVRQGPVRTRKRALRPSDRTDVWRTLRERVDPAKFTPKLADDIEVKRFHARGGDYVMIANPRDLIHYRLDLGEAELLGLMDGTRSVEDIVIDHLHEAGELELSGVADLVLGLYQGNFLDLPYLDVDAALARALDPVSPSRRKLRIFLKTQTFEWSGPQRVVEWFYEHGLKAFFTPIGKVASLVLAVFGSIAFFAIVHGRQYRIGGSQLALEGLIFLGLTYLLTFAHELGHALVVVHDHRRLKSAGFMIYFGSPAWFVDTSDALMMDPNKRVAMAFAGPYAQVLLAGVASLILWGFPHISAGHLLFKFAAINYLLIFLNLIPLLELDGYHILSDLIQVPDLRPRSLSFVRYDLLRKIRVRERFRSNEVGLGLYGILGVVFTIFSFYTGGLYWKSLFGGFVSSLWRGGLGTRLVLLLLALFVGGPLIRGAVGLARFSVRKVRAAWRSVQFRLETDWRVEAATLIDALPIFDDVPEDTLDDLAGRVRLRSFSTGRSVVRQGERAEAFYVVRTGSLEVFETDPESGQTNVLRILGRGESFGELAVAAATVRTASVRALEDSEVFEIDRSTFHRLLADMIEIPDFAPTFQQIAELRELDSFKHLEPDELADLVQYGDWVTYAPGETIVKEGAEADGFFTIGSGQVEVLRGRKRLAAIGPGSHFGEIALLLGTGRTATVRARTPVRAYRLTREGFERLMREAFKKGTLSPHGALDRTWQH